MQTITKSSAWDCNKLKHISLHESVGVIELQLTVQNLLIAVGSFNMVQNALKYWANKKEVLVLIR